MGSKKLPVRTPEVKVRGKWIRPDSWTENADGSLEWEIDNQNNTVIRGRAKAGYFRYSYPTEQEQL